MDKKSDSKDQEIIKLVQIIQALQGKVKGFERNQASLDQIIENSAKRNAEIAQ